MKYVASIILALCFAASMVSCSREDGFEKKEEDSLSSISTVTELDSSSELDFVASSSCAAEPITEEAEVSTTITTNIEINSTEESTSATSTTTSRHDKNGQLIETTIEEVVTKPIESTAVVEIMTKPIKSTTALEGPIIVTGIDEYSYQLLAEIVEHEAGSDWISLYDKAHVAAATMNRVYDSRFPNTVYDVLVQPGQYTGYWPGCITPRSTAYEAVDYYFAHPNEFDNSNSWFGDGWANYFYYQ